MQKLKLKTKFMITFLCQVIAQQILFKVNSSCHAEVNVYSYCKCFFSNKKRQG